MSEKKFPPRVAPRDTADALIAAVIGIGQSAVLFGLPGLLVWYASGSSVMAFVAAGILYMGFLMCCVTDITVTDDGLRLKRVLGDPELIRWKDITEVKEASRAELILHGWLWPLMLPREMTPTTTSIGHFRIQYGPKWIYYPPMDAMGFQDAVQARMFSRAA